MSGSEVLLAVRIWAGDELVLVDQAVNPSAENADDVAQHHAMVMAGWLQRGRRVTHEVRDVESGEVVSLTFVEPREAMGADEVLGAVGRRWNGRNGGRNSERGGTE